MISKKQVVLLILLSFSKKAFADEQSDLAGPASQAYVPQKFVLEDTCPIGLDPKHLGVCAHLFKQAVVGSSNDALVSTLTTKEDRKKIREQANCKAKGNSFEAWQANLEFHAKKDLENFVQTRISRTEQFYQHLSNDAEKKAKHAISRGFILPSSKHLSNSVCNDTRLLYGDDGSAIKSIVNILFRQTSPVSTTFGYVGAMEAISSPTTDIEHLKGFQEKLKKLLSDQKLLVELKGLLNKLGSLEHAYFNLDKMPEPESYNPTVHKNYSDWEYKVNSRTFMLQDWANIQTLDKWGYKAFATSVLATVTADKLSFITGPSIKLFILLGMFFIAAHESGKRDQEPIGVLFETIAEYCFGFATACDKWKTSKKVGKSFIVGSALFSLILCVQSFAGWGFEQVRNPNYYWCKFNSLRTILWAKNFCVDIRNFLNLAMEIEQKAFYVRLGDGQSITESILKPKNKALRNCLQCLLNDDVFKEKCDENSFWDLACNARSIHKILYVLVYLIQGNHSFMVDIARRIGEIDYSVATVGLVANSSRHKNAFKFVEFQKPINGQAFVDCKGAWNPFGDPLSTVANNIHFGPKVGSKKPGAEGGLEPINGYILTGGNGCGKSFFASAVILSIILGQTLGIAPVASMRFTPFDEILTYVKVEADPVKGQSLFMAQLASAGKLAAFVEIAKKEGKLAFLWMDESLSGTRWTLGTAISQALLLKCFANQPHLSMIFATHLDLLARNCERRANGSVMPIMIDAELKPNGQFLRSKYKVKPGVSTHDSAFSLVESQWKSYPFCKEVCELALKEYDGLEPIEEFGKKIAIQMGNAIEA